MQMTGVKLSLIYKLFSKSSGSKIQFIRNFVWSKCVPEDAN